MLYTEEPNAFETESERQMQKDLELKIDQEYLKHEKDKNKYVVKMICILNNLKKKLNFEYTISGKFFRLYFDSKYQYNKFIASGKNSDNFNICIDYFPKRTFEKLGNDQGARFLLLKVR